MKILITGIAGFVGSTLARSMLRNNPETQIVGIDNLSYGYIERVQDFIDEIDFYEADVRDLVRVVPNNKFDAIIHCAAIAPLPECQIDSFRAIEQNVAICGSVADFALKTETRNIVFFSSGAIYEGTREFPTSERVQIQTRLVYPTTKHMAEMYFQAMTRSHDINVIALRLFNLYGPHQDYFRKQPPLIGYILKNLIENQKAVLYSTGEQSRDYIYIEDLLVVINLAIEKLHRYKSGGNFLALNVGSGESVSVNEIIQKIERISGKKLNLRREIATKYWDKYESLFINKIALKSSIIQDEVNKSTLADVEKTRRELGWIASITVDDGLRECYEFAKKLIQEQTA